MAEANTVTITLDRYNELLEIEKVATGNKEYSILTKPDYLRIETNDAIIKDLSDKLDKEKEKSERTRDILKSLKDLQNTTDAINIRTRDSYQEVKEKKDRLMRNNDDLREENHKLKIKIQAMPLRIAKKYGLGHVY